MTSHLPSAHYRERLLPGPGLLLTMLLFVPAVTLVVSPINSLIALPAGILVYALLITPLILLSPVIRLENGILTAGTAQIPVDQLGEIELLTPSQLRHSIGAAADARNYLVIRGWIHQGVKIENIDDQDPTPHWIITTRNPERLTHAIRTAQAAPTRSPRQQGNTGQ